MNTRRFNNAFAATIAGRRAALRHKKHRTHARRAMSNRTVDGRRPVECARIDFAATGWNKRPVAPVLSGGECKIVPALADFVVVAPA